MAQTFFVDGLLRQDRARLGDHRGGREHIGLRLDDSRRRRADRLCRPIVLNKTDLVSEAELKAVESRIRRLNPLAPIHRAERSKVDLETVLSRGGFDLNRIVALEPEFLSAAHGEAGHVHDEHCDRRP